METKIPEGLEKRLLASIDRWEREEQAQKRRARIGWVAAACVAAVVALLSLPSFFGDADKQISQNDKSRMAVGERSAAANDTTSLLCPIPTPDISVKRLLADKAIFNKKKEMVADNSSDTAFYMELETVEVHPAYELSEVHVEMQPASIATYDSPTNCNDVHYINPATYSSDGVRLGEIEIMQRN